MLTQQFRLSIYLFITLFTVACSQNAAMVQEPEEAATSADMEHESTEVQGSQEVSEDETENTDEESDEEEWQEVAAEVIRMRLDMDGLHVLMCHFNWPCVKDYLVAGFNINICNELGLTVLHNVVLGGHADLLPFLEFYLEPSIRFGVTQKVEAFLGRSLLEPIVVPALNLNPQLRGSRMTPLHIAVIKNQKAMVEWLMRNGADPEILTENGCTALRLAIIGKDFSLVKCLVDHGASVKTVDAEGRKPKDFARILGCHAMADYLDDSGYCDDTASIVAVCSRHTR